MLARPSPQAGYSNGALAFVRRALAQFPEMKQLAAARYAQTPPTEAPGAATPPAQPLDLSGLRDADVVRLYDELAGASTSLDMPAAARLQELVDGLR